MAIIAISGYAGSGKDTAADYLVSHFNFKKVCFADAIKEAASFIFDVPLEYFYHPVMKEISMKELGGNTPRHVLQQLGTEFGRKINPNVWINKAVNRIQQIEQDVVISDLRFENEANAIQYELKGDIWYVERHSLQLTNTHQHSSETYTLELKSRADHILYNNLSITDLEIQVGQLYINEYVR